MQWQALCSEWSLIVYSKMAARLTMPCRSESYIEAADIWVMKPPQRDFHL